MNKKEWNKPHLTNLNVCETKNSECPAATGVSPTHDFGIWGSCEHYCKVCGGCKLYPFMQSLCPYNVYDPINHCENACNGGCPSPDPGVPGSSN